MKALNSRGYVLFIQVLSAFFLALAYGCDAPKEKKLYLDRDFASYCDAFEASAKLALALHLQKDRGDFPSLRKNTPVRLAQDLGVEFSGDASKERCADIQAVGDAAAAKEKNLSELQLYQAALTAFTGQLDAHSTYWNSEAVERMTALDANQKYGIGVEFRSRLVDKWQPIRDLIVEEVFPDSPAENKLKAGDRITKIGGKNVQGLLLTDAISATSSMITASVILRLEDDGREVEILPDRFHWFPVMGTLEERSSFRAGYIQIRAFTKGTADLLAAKLQELGNEGAEGFLVDLRNNPGGDIDEAIRIAADLTGREISLFERGNPAKHYQNAEHRKKPEETLQGKPLVVLIDPGSASAAEIVAGAVWTDTALVVGQRSFGKGVGQDLIVLSGRRKNNLGGTLLLTMFRYEFADHFCPQIVSVVPHISISDPELDAVLAERKGKGQATILHEEDFGKDLTIPSSNGAQREKTARLASEIARIDGLNKAGEYASVCEGKDDCAKETAMAFLETLLKIRSTKE